MSLQSRLPARAALSRRGLALAGATAAFAAVPVAAQAATSVPGEALTLSPSNAGAVLSESSAHGGRALRIWSNGSGSRSVSQTEASARLVVRARGEQCNGAPQMAVDVDGRRVLLSTVSATSYADYSANVSVGSGSHTVRVAFLNDYRSGCDRNLIVDTVSLQGSGTTAPPAPSTTGFEAEDDDPADPHRRRRHRLQRERRQVAQRLGPGRRPRAPHALDAGKLVVRAKGEQCGGAPRVGVKVDGAEVLNAEVTVHDVGQLHRRPSPTPAGSRNVSVEFTNDLHNSSATAT